MARMPGRARTAAGRVTAERLESVRLVLEPLRPEHADELARVLDDVSLHRFTGGSPLAPEELRTRFDLQARGVSSDGRDRWLNWVVRERATGRAVGTVQATVRGPESASIAYLAWVVGTEHQGHGFAKEAVAAMSGWLRERGIVRRRANIHPHHGASMAVARAVGLVPSGVIVDGEVRWESSA
jgi:RimJ/RimL family protein N-acetyltransferase